MKMFERFFVPLAFFSRLPVPGSLLGQKDLSRATFLFPVIGLVIGGVASVGAMAFDEASPVLGMLAAFLLPILISGGIHLDGLADSSDGLFYAGDKKRRLEIMRDSKLGVYAVLALMMDLLFRFVGTFYIWFSHKEYLWCIFLMPFVGKIGILFLLGHGKSPETPGSLSEGLADKTRPDGAWLWLVVLVLLIGYTGIPFLWWFFVVTVLIVSIWAYSRIDGASGDLCGFVNEIWEITFLLTIVATLYSV